MFEFGVEYDGEVAVAAWRVDVSNGRAWRHDGVGWRMADQATGWLALAHFAPDGSFAKTLTVNKPGPEPRHLHLEPAASEAEAEALSAV